MSTKKTMGTTIKTELRYDTTNPKRHCWYVAYLRDGVVIDDSETPWHPAMPTRKDSRRDAEQMAAEYAVKLAEYEAKVAEYEAKLAQS